MLSSTTTRAKLHSPLTWSVIMYAFRLSFPFPGVVPAFLHIVQNRKILRNGLIIHFFWHKFQPTMFPALFFLSSLADCALKHITSLIQWKGRQQTCKRFKQRKCSPASSQRFFSTWPCKLLSTYKRWIDRVWHRCRKEWHRPELTQPALLPMTLHQQTVQKKSYFIECTYMHKLSEWIIHAEVSIIFQHLAVCGIKHYVIYEHTEQNWCN